MVGIEGAAIGILKGKALTGFKKDPSTSSAMACGWVLLSFSYNNQLVDH